MLARNHMITAPAPAATTDTASSSTATDNSLATATTTIGALPPTAIPAGTLASMSAATLETIPTAILAVAPLPPKAMSWPLSLKLLALLSVLWLLFVLSGSYWYSSDPYAMNIQLSLHGPSAEHLFGNDRLGRDLLARLFKGAWTSLSLAGVIILISMVIGTVIGLFAAMSRGFIAKILEGVINALLSFPQNLAVILVSGLLGIGIWHSVMALCLFWWIHFARICYCRAVSLLKEEYIRQARYSGESAWSIMRIYIFPQLQAQLLLTAWLDLSSAILALATLSFLGLSTPPPEPEWGAMLFENRAYLQNAPHLLFFPAMFIFISALLCNLLGQSYMRYQQQRQPYLSSLE